jgi:hypothetical protein
MRGGTKYFWTTCETAKAKWKLPRTTRNNNQTNIELTAHLVRFTAIDYVRVRVFIPV